MTKSLRLLPASWDKGAATASLAAYALRHLEVGSLDSVQPKTALALALHRLQRAAGDQVRELAENAGRQVV
jgi:hypothetical protein